MADRPLHEEAVRAFVLAIATGLGALVLGVVVSFVANSGLSWPTIGMFSLSAFLLSWGIFRAVKEKTQPRGVEDENEGPGPPDPA